MTNIYDVLSKMHVKATADVEKTVEEDLKKEDPSEEEAKAVLGGIPLELKATHKQDLKTDPTSEGGNESTKGNEKKRSPRSNK